MAEAFIALGGNVGDVRATFGQAIVMLCSDQHVRLTARSSDYRSPPWGDLEQPPFINAVISVATNLEPHALLLRMQECERALGRDRTKARRWGPRTIDLDLLLYEGCTVSDEQLILPHPRMAERAFVLVPLDEIAPDTIIGGMTAHEALAALDVEGVEKLPAL